MEILPGVDRETSISSTEVEQEDVIIENSHIEMASEVKTSNQNSAIEDRETLNQYVKEKLLGAINEILFDFLNRYQELANLTIAT